MAETTDGRSHNKPTHEASVKGGENSHKNTGGSSSDDEKTSASGSSTDGRSHNAPSHEASVKGGQHSHSGSSKE